MAEAEEETKVASESASLRCRIDSNFSGRICWSNLELESLIEPQEEAKENDTKTEDWKTKQLRTKLAEKDALIDRIKKDLNSLKSSKGETEKLLAESEKVVEQLKAGIQRQKASETRLYDSFVTQTSQLEQAMIFIDKWKHKMAAVKERTGITSYEENYWLRLQVERLEKELQIQRNGQNPWKEVKRLRKELEQAIEAEVNSKRAMDDLALVIKEVAAEANKTKEKFTSTEQQLQLMKEETENLKSMISIKEKAQQLSLTEAKSMEEKNRVALGEVKKESESLKATIDRLRIEVKEKLPSLDGKETDFVDSIKKAEEEKVNMKEEKNKLIESFNEAKDESRKLRDILQQAKVEIAQLKDSLAEKEIAFVALTQETEKLRNNEAAANENIKELKRQIPTHARNDSKSEEKEQKKNKKESSSEKDSKGNGKSTGNSKGSGKPFGDLKGGRKSTGDLKSCGKSAGSFCSLSIPVSGLSAKNKEEQEHGRDDDLTDSIFDLVQTAPAKHHHTRSASAITFTDEGSSINSEDFDNSNSPHADDMEIDKGSHPKKKVLLKKFSELWKRKSHSHSHSHSHSRSHSHSQSQSHNHNQNHSSHQKEVAID